MEALIILTLIGSIWLIAPRKWRNRFLIPLTLIILIFIALTSSWVSSLVLQGLLLPLPKDIGSPADAIVILGRGEALRNSRIVTAASLWRAKRAPKILASGYSDASSIIQELKNLGIPSSQLQGEECSGSTEENGQFISTLLPTGQTLLLVTDPPHMLRSLWIFESFGWKVLPQISSLPTEWSTPQILSLIVREYIGVLHYQLTRRFNQHTLSDRARLQAEATSQMKHRNCQI